MFLLLADRKKKTDQASDAFQPGEGTLETWPNAIGEIRWGFRLEISNICSGLALNSHLYKDNIRIIK